MTSRFISSIVNDQLMQPQVARRLLQHRLSTGVLRAGNATWRVLAREGHHFHRVESWAEIYGAASAMLDP